MVTVAEQKGSVAPGPRGLPVVGSAIGLLRDILGTTLKGMHEYGDVVRYVAGPPGPMRVIAYGIAHPDGVQHVLAGGASHYSKQDAAYVELRGLVGDGLLTSEGETWRRQKRMVQPLFTHRRVGGYVDMMAEEAAGVVDRWDRSAERGETVDLHGEMTRLSLRVVGRALFGADVEEILPTFKDNVPFLSRRAFVRSITPVMIPQHWPTPGNRHGARAQDEVDEVPGERPPALEDVGALSVTTMAVKEAMRLYPAAYAIPRLTEEADELNGYAIPAGSVAVVSPWVTHRHPRFWDDPERFDPERFTPEREKARHRYAYFPFGGGPRACIGQYFSMLEAVIVTAMLARAYRLTSPSGPVPLLPGITLRPRRAMPCRIERR